ncbi:MAG: hypothetical protein IPM38_07755 [Ignavibacteria bacterium]|nr:hypothetical protein [Ignavibacteria bacterium]
MPAAPENPVLSHPRNFLILEIDPSEDFADYNIDGALITNPTFMHIETALKIAEYGIPMFIEKPLVRI